MDVFFIILLILIIAVIIGLIVLVIFLSIKFLRWVFKPQKYETTGDINDNLSSIIATEEWQKFCEEKVRYWNNIIKNQKHHGTFDENKKVYDSGEYKGIKYRIIRSDKSDEVNKSPEEDLLIQMLIFTQTLDKDF